MKTFNISMFLGGLISAFSTGPQAPLFGAFLLPVCLARRWHFGALHPVEEYINAGVLVFDMTSIYSLINRNLK
tara:strand:- start:555 stop:773 length:219 start_codon:yes stop_codon:yes gene_type:complete